MLSENKQNPFRLGKSQLSSQFYIILSLFLEKVGLKLIHKEQMDFANFNLTVEVENDGICGL